MVNVKGGADLTPLLTEIPIGTVNPDKSALFVDVNMSGIGSNEMDYSTTLTSSKIQISTTAPNAMLSKKVSVVWQVVEHY